MSKVRTIPATINPLTFQPLNQTQKRKVCAYARVSTDSTDQENSFEAQVRAYTKMIKETNSSLTSWSDSIWLTSIDKCIINVDKTIEFHFKNGSKIKV